MRQELWWSLEIGAMDPERGETAGLAFLV